MKKIMIVFLSISALFLTGTHVFASEIQMESHISQVAVYPDAALITRGATVEVKPGEHQLIFSDIIPVIDENSLRVTGQGTARVKILGAQIKKVFLEEKPAERVRQLEKDIEDLTSERKKYENTLSVLEQEKEFLNSLRLFSQGQLPKDLVTKTPSPKDVDDLLKFLDTNLKNNFAAELETERAMQELDKKMEVLTQELAQIKTPSKTKRSVVVDVEVLKAGTLELTISYLVQGASWRPVYDVRASFEKSQAELISFGIVHQTTGEDWENVDIILSTARPLMGGKMPDVLSWFLRPYEPPRRLAEAQYEPYYMERSLGAAGGVNKDSLSAIGGQASSDFAAPPVKAKAEVSYAAVQMSGFSVVYRIPRKATIKSDGTEVKLPIASQALAAKFKYASYPKALPSVYLASRVTNSKDLQLLPGPANLFLEDDFVGSSQIEAIAPSESFDLYLGVDENVKAKREEIEKKTDDVLIGNIPSPNRKVTLKYKLTVENYKAKNITFELFEAMPVSQDERIKVKIDHVSLEPKDKDYRDKKGVWRWELELQPKAKQEIFYTVTIECPRGMKIEGF